jgi:hypothetical protein
MGCVGLTALLPFYVLQAPVLRGTADVVIGVIG